MSDEAWGLITAVALAVVAGVGWLMRRLIEPRLSPEAATAVQKSTAMERPPTSHNEAIVALAIEIGELRLQNNAWSIFAYELENWGIRGWDRAGPPREPMPRRPHILTPRRDPEDDG